MALLQPVADKNILSSGSEQDRFYPPITLHEINFQILSYQVTYTHFIVKDFLDKLLPDSEYVINGPFPAAPFNQPLSTLGLKLNKTTAVDSILKINAKPPQSKLCKQFS